MSSRTWIFSLLIALAMLAGCGVTDLFIGSLPTTSTTTTSTTTTSTTTTSTTTTSTTTTSSTVCAPGASRSCYDGPAGTEGQGLCKAGSQTCANDGASWGACVGEVLPKPEDCATPEDEDCDGKAPACTGTLRWARRFGDGADQHAAAVVALGNGNVVLAGDFAGAMNVGTSSLLASTGGRDAFIVGLDGSTGSTMWARSWGDTSDQWATSLAASADGAGVIVGGTFAGSVDPGVGAMATLGIIDGIVARLDAGTGSTTWARQLGGAGAKVRVAGVAALADGGALAVGSLHGTMTIDGFTVDAQGTTDVFAVALDVTGTAQWVKTWGAVGATCSAVAVATGGGRSFIAGDFHGGFVDFGSGPVASVVSSGFVLEADPSIGAAAWARSFGATSSVSAVAAGQDGSALLVGTFYGGSIDLGAGPMSPAGDEDAFAAVYGADGSLAFGRSFGEKGAQAGGLAVAVDAFGNRLLAGNLHGSVSFGGAPLASAGAADAYLVKLRSDGAHTWSGRFGASGATTTAAGVATDGAGNVVLVGDADGALDFGGGLLPPGGGADVYVASFAP
jgi:hypothetical protein